MADPQPEVKVKFIRKKGGHAAAHGGGAWKIAYADLVTAMMAFFLLMWLLGSANKNTLSGVAGMFKDPNFFNTPAGKEILDNHGKGILPGGRGMKDAEGEGGQTSTETSPNNEATPSPEAEHKAMESTAKAIEDAFTQDKILQAFKDQISMDFTDEGLRIQITDKVSQALFDSGSANVKPYTMTILKEIGAELAKLPNQISIGGHTDSAAYSSKAFTNWELSSERACAARRILESSGVRQGQVRRVMGYADTVPVEGKGPTDPQNRRISILVLSSAVAKADSAHQKSKGSFRD